MNANRLIGAVVFLATLAVYVATTSPDIYWEDSGEITTAAATLGLPHSPSFPLYLICARSFIALGWDAPARMAALFSAIMGAAAVCLIYAFNVQLLSLIREGGRADRLTLPLAAATGALATAFTFAVWINSVRAEVYTLALTGCIAIYLCTMSICRAWFDDDAVRYKRIVLLSLFLLGLTAGNHTLLAVFCVPGVLTAAFLFRQRAVSTLSLAMLSFFAGVLGFTIYAFLPIRSSLDPALDWGDPESLGRFVDAVLRRQSLSSAGLVSSDAGRAATVFSLPVIDYGLAVFWIGVLGALRLWKRSRKLFLTGVVFVLPAIMWCTFVLRFMLDNYDARAYVFSFTVVWGTLIAVAFDTLIPRMKTAARAAAGLIVGSAAVVAVAMPNVGRCNLAGGPHAGLWGREILRASPFKAVILPGTDSGIFSLWYLSLVENRRPDVAVVGRIVRLPWYNEYLEAHYPDMRWPSRMWMDSVSWRADQTAVLRRRVVEIVATNPDRRFVWEAGTDDMIAERHLLPSGPVCMVSPDPLDSLSRSSVTETLDYWSGFSSYLDTAAWFRRDEKAARVLSVPPYNMGRLVFAYRDIGSAIRFNEVALTIRPDHSQAMSALGVCAEARGNLQQAEQLYRAAIETGPMNADALYNLARIEWHVHDDASEALLLLRRADESEPNNDILHEATSRLREAIAAGER